MLCISGIQENLSTALQAASDLSRPPVVSPSKPNIIVILADDLGYADIGFHEVVADGVHTPNLDKLAKSGVVFRNAYSSSPICSGARLALSTGRYPQRWGGYYYGQGGLPTTEFTLAELLRDGGYRTMKIGKTHMNNGPKANPTTHGFEQSFGFRHHSWHFSLISQKDVDAYERRLEGSAERHRSAPIGPLMRNDSIPESFENTTTTEVFADESVKFIKQDSDKPFYLQLEFNAVHTPLIRPPKQLAKKYGIPLRPFDRNAESWDYPQWDPVKQPDYKEWYGQTCHLEITDPFGRKIYLAHLELMDQMIGKIMKTLRDEGMWKNTLIFFSSDNGGSDQSYANNGNINAYKYCVMDGGIKVPMVVSWPAGFKAGTSVDGTVTHRDLFASICEITGFQPKKELDSKSLLPLISGNVDEIHPEPLYWDCGPKRNNWTVRHGDWKLVYAGEAKDYQAYELDKDGLVLNKLRIVPTYAGLQLFNLKKDPGERNNLVDKQPERVASMQKLYDDWRGQMSDPISGRNAK
ncbi:MAG: sulfatase [Puniceicoccaceae bacterium]